MSRKRSIQGLSSIERMALRAFIDHGQIPKITVMHKLVQLRLITPGPLFELQAGVIDAVVEYERDTRRRHLSDPEQILRALRARRDPPIS